MRKKPQKGAKRRKMVWRTFLPIGGPKKNSVEISRTGSKLVEITRIDNEGNEGNEESAGRCMFILPAIRCWDGKYFFTADHCGILRMTADLPRMTADARRYLGPGERFAIEN